MNPVPRCKHPDWLHKKLLEKNDVFRQKKISEMFMPSVRSGLEQDSDALVSHDPSAQTAGDIEDIATKTTTLRPSQPVASKRKRDVMTSHIATEDELSKSWRQLLGDPPPMGTTKVRAHGVVSLMRIV